MIRVSIVGLAILVLVFSTSDATGVPVTNPSTNVLAGDLRIVPTNGHLAISAGTWHGVPISVQEESTYFLKGE